MNLPRFALERKSLVLAVLALALFWSLTAALGMQRREDPGTTQRQTEIVTAFPGATTENVEQLVTKKIVDDIRAVPHVLHVTGASRPGISDVQVEFDDEINEADGVLRDVRNKLAGVKATLPAGITGPALIDDAWTTYPLVIGLTGEGLSQRALRDVAKDLKDQLVTLPDVGNVVPSGAQTQEVDVRLDLRALSTYALAPGDVVQALENRNALVPSGTVSVSGRLAQIDPGDPLHTLADVGAVSVLRSGARVVHVRDVAQVATGYPDPPAEIVRIDGKPGIALAVTAKDTSSVTALGPEVKRLVARDRADWPAGVEAVFVADQPRTVDERIGDFTLNLLLALVIVTGLVALFMGPRNGILVGLTVVLTIALTFGAMKLLSVDINQISLLALIISLGIVVDAGIVAIDNIELHLRQGMERRTAAWRGVHDLWIPLLTSTLVAMSSFLPFRLMGGSVGDFVRDLGVVTSISLAMSLVVAYFVTPILGEWFAVAANGRSGQGADALLEGLRRIYVPIATASLQRPYVTVAIAGLLFVGAVSYMPHLGVQFFPSADRNQFFIDVNAPEGTDIRTTEAIVQQVESLLAKAKPAGVTAYGSFVGAGAPRFYYNVLSEQPKPSYAQIIVDTTGIASANVLVERLRSETAEIAGARIDVKRLEQGPPVGAPIQVRFSGEDAAALAAVSAKAQDLLRSVPGASGVRDSLGVRATTLRAQIDETRAAQAGVDPGAVQQLLALAYGGTTATQIRESDRQTPVVVRLPRALRSDAEQFGALGVRNADGASVPIAEVASLHVATQTSVATYRDGLPTVTVLAEVEGRLASDVLADFRKAAATLAVPAGVRMAYAGEDEQSAKSFRNLLIAVIVGLLVNQIVLLWEFRRLRLSLVVLTAVPLGLIGAIAGLALTGQHFGFIAALGIASLGGIVTNHAIVLFEYAKREMEAGHAMDDALILAGTKRLRPILLTVVASVAGLLPLAFSAQTLWRPFCWAVIFGLCGSTLMTLVAIPAIFRLASGGTKPSARPQTVRPTEPRVEVGV